ncbi:tetratricopeptide repeat protein [Aquimarina sp. 2201CG14-23]|uniref:tetratricopeptide repeat protein n=1 Tax=Aquimarina mycalae TaxID=3040073 RepID=UPI002477CFD6|nr:tetratricopeptide repeat protein [Aquimarina sp. 2201CG14-23]MDH7447805.1 tetratricopeptide repeat protein [Aquimarina sp. 2201CG14-23]
MEKKESLQSIIPITSSSEKAKEHFEKARFLVQNGINSNPTTHYKKAIELDSSFARMYNFISMYSQDDSIKKLNHELAKKYKHLVSKEEQILIDATEFRLKNPDDIYETKLFELGERCPSDKYLHHSICFLLFRKNPSLAIKAGKKSIELDKDYGSGYNILGYAYINNNELDKANEAFDNFIRCEPKNANPYDSKADLMLKLGNYQEALKLKQKAYELDKSFDWIPEEIIDIKSKIDSLTNK